MSNFKIEIEPTGASIRDSEVLYDAQGNQLGIAGTKTRSLIRKFLNLVLLLKKLLMFKVNLHLELMKQFE